MYVDDKERVDKLMRPCGAQLANSSPFFLVNLDPNEYNYETN